MYAKKKQLAMTQRDKDEYKPLCGFKAGNVEHKQVNESAITNMQSALQYTLRNRVNLQ